MELKEAFCFVIGCFKFHVTLLSLVFIIAYFKSAAEAQAYVIPEAGRHLLLEASIKAAVATTHAPELGCDRWAV